MVKYGSFGLSLRGATHVKNDLPNQDYFESYVSDDESFAVIAVCDGHGSEKYIRSDIGSKIAAEQATILMKEFLENHSQLKTESNMEDDIKRLERNILFYWREKVSEYTEKNPLTDEEYNAIKTKKNLQTAKDVRENNILAYGSTLIAIGLTQEYILCIQIGDGDITLLTEKGEKINPMHNDKRLIANETTSLCGDMAIHDFRNYFSYDLPIAVTACTDGIANSYIMWEDFLQLTKDIHDEITEKGEEKTLHLLDEGLNRLSINGSGDDVTLAIIYR